MKIKGNTRPTSSSTIDAALWVTLGLYSKPSAEASSFGRNQPGDTCSERHGRVLFLPPFLIWIGKLLTKSHSCLYSFASRHRWQDWDLKLRLTWVVQQDTSAQKSFQALPPSFRLGKTGTKSFLCLFFLSGSFRSHGGVSIFLEKA